MANENGMEFLASLLRSAGPLNPAKSIIDQMRMAGKPRVSQTVATQPDEPIDLGSIGMLLFMLLKSGLLGGTPAAAGGGSSTPAFSLATPGVSMPGTSGGFQIPKFSLK